MNETKVFTDIKKYLFSYSKNVWITFNINHYWIVNDKRQLPRYQA